MSKVLLTRPDGENEKLLTMLEATNVSAQVRPLIKVLALKVGEAQKQVAMNLDQYDKIIFVSKNSVQFAMPLLDSYWPQWPAALGWFAVGPGTRSALSAYDVAVKVPMQAGSEGLLELAGLQEVAGQHILICRGDGGRELLAQTLDSRGARVTYLETYRRQRVKYDNWQEAPNCIVVTSLEILQTLMDQLGGLCREATVIVASERIAASARHRGFAGVINAGGASDQALYDALLPIVTHHGTSPGK